MAKKGLFISRVDVEQRIKEFCGGDVLEAVLLNEATHQYRYTLSKNDISFSLDTYYRNDNTCTLVAIGSGQKKELSNELKIFIESNVDINNSAKVDFSTMISEENFDKLIEFLESQPHVKKCDDSENPPHGRVVLMTTDFGDRATLTYFKTSQKMRFQGFMMSIYVFTKTFLTPFDSEISKITDTNIVSNNGQKKIETLVNDFFAAYLPNYYQNANIIVKNLIEDTITLMKLDDKLNDYGVWTFPIFRVLEHRLKEILSFDDIIISDKRGFKSGENYKDPIFQFNEQTKKHCVNPKLNQINIDYVPFLEEGYNYLVENRHQMFHGNQYAIDMRLISTNVEAQEIIIEICKMLEKSYNIANQ